ncbi:unnamed protein product [Protopolystoma xenopodis]|uniref:Uncharacterized protein n=1 Tax=Protopolystoma xenopodis TaxID=117903 RepID=A0A448XDQ7_9PLAT|nr:unnamed protein product [Protopolystoma xenopodis]
MLLCTSVHGADVSCSEWLNEGCLLAGCDERCNKRLTVRFINGILLITTDSLCFDTADTAANHSAQIDRRLHVDSVTDGVNGPSLFSDTESNKQPNLVTDSLADINVAATTTSTDPEPNSESLLSSPAELAPGATAFTPLVDARSPEQSGSPPENADPSNLNLFIHLDAIVSLSTHRHLQDAVKDA